MEKPKATVSQLPPTSLTINKLHIWTGLPRDRIIEALLDVHPVKTSGEWKYYSVKDAMRAICNPKITDTDQLSPRERKDWYDSEAQRLKVETAKRDLVPIDEFRDTLAGILKELARDLESWPDKLERNHAGTPELVEILEKFVDEARETIYQRIVGISDEGAAADIKK